MQAETHVKSVLLMKAYTERYKLSLDGHRIALEYIGGRK